MKPSIIRYSKYTCQKKTVKLQLKISIIRGKYN